MKELVIYGLFAYGCLVLFACIALAVLSYRAPEEEHIEEEEGDDFLVHFDWPIWRAGQ